MAIVKIQHRRGDYNDYDPSKVLPGEMVVTLANDPNASDGRGVYIGTVSGHVKQLATVEDMEAEVATALDEAVPAAVSDATARAEAAAQSAAQSARTLTIDNTLTQHGQVPESYAAGQIVVVSDTQPSAVSNKMWLNPSSEEVEIPTAADLSTVTQSVNSLQQDVTELEGAIDDVQTNLTTEITKANDNVANEFRISINNTYPVGTYVIHEGVLYVCNTETSARSWDPAKWTRVRVMPQFSTLRKDITGDYAEVSGASTATIDFSMSFTHTYVFHNKGTGTITSVVARSAGGGNIYTVAENLVPGEKVEVVHPTGYETVVVTFGSQSTLAMYDKDTMRGELENEIYSIDIDVDDTLTEEGKAADAKATGDEITNLKQDLNELEDEIDNAPEVKDSDAEGVDLDLCDVNGNVIVRFANGHIKTGEFDSSQINADTDTEVMSQITDDSADLYISDTHGKGLVRFAGGHIQTAKFTSDNSVYRNVFEYADMSGTATINHFFPKGTRLAFHLVRADTAGWGYIANYNVTYKYTDKNGIIHTLGVDYGYNFPTFTLPEDAKSVSVTFGAGLTYHETTDLAFCVYPEASFEKQPKIITVSPSGGKDFTTIREAVDSIPVDVCELNPYEIHVYPGTYDILADYTASEIAAEGFKGLFLNNGTSLIGIGQRDEIILTASMDTTIYDNTKRNDVSTLNIYGNVHIENVIIKGENIRYAVHDEGSMMTHKFNIHSFKNVKFVGKNLTSGGGGINAYGAGCSSNKQIRLIDCDFLDQLGIHSQYDLQHEVTFYLENCTARRFAFTDYENTNANAHVVLRNCKADIITISQTTDGQTQSMTFDGIGECNALIKCPTGYVYNFGCCNEFVGANISAGYAVKLNTYLNNVEIATNRNQIYGISIGVRDGNTVVQTRGYINSNTLNISGLAIGDYLTIDNTGKVTSGGTSENAIAVVKIIDAYGVAFAKLMI